MVTKREEGSVAQTAGLHWNFQTGSSEVVNQKSVWGIMHNYNY